MKYKGIRVILLAGLLLYASCHDKSTDTELNCNPIRFNTGQFENGSSDVSTQIISTWIEDNCLGIEVSYSGGCKDHIIELAARGWIKTYPPQVEARITHDNTDPCESEVIDTLVFDLRPLRFDNEMKIIINLEGSDVPLTHTFID